MAEDETDGVVVSSARVGHGVAADLLDTDAARRGVTGELSVTTDYPLARRWAGAFAEAGFDGIRYQPRFSSDRAFALAIFGDEGAPSIVPLIIDTVPVRDIWVAHGYSVVPTPNVTDLGPLLD